MAQTDTVKITSPAARPVKDTAEATAPSSGRRDAPATSAAKAREANRRYRVGIGATFDFLNGLSATDIYGDVSVSIPDVFQLAGRTWGIDAGLYNARATSRRETRELTRTFLFRDTPVADSTTRVVQQIERVEDRYRDNLGLYFAPAMRLNDWVSLAFHSEAIRREYVQTVSIKTLSADTTVEGPNATGGITGPSTLPRDTTRTTRTSRYASFFGVGPLIDFSEDDYNFWHKPLIGVEVVEGRLRGAYAVQFRLTDFDHGFKLGGEVRGGLTFNAPSITVFLAKDFSLARLANFVAGGDDDDDGEGDNDEEEDENGDGGDDEGEGNDESGEDPKPQG